MPQGPVAIKRLRDRLSVRDPIQFNYNQKVDLCKIGEVRYRA